MPDLVAAAMTFTPTSVEDEYFTNDCEVWLIKSARTPTREKARMVVAEIGGGHYMDYGCRTVRGRVEWIEREGWFFHCDPDGPLEAWEVYAR